MSRLLLLIPAAIVVFFFVTLTYSYIKYKSLKPPVDIPTNNAEFHYLNKKLGYFEDGIISIGFIVIFLLIVIAVPLYVNMYKVQS